MTDEQNGTEYNKDDRVSDDIKERCQQDLITVRQEHMSNSIARSHQYGCKPIIDYSKLD